MSGGTGATRAKEKPGEKSVELSEENVLEQQFNPVGQLLHALNQPLTGLQCSLELATVGARGAEQYLQAIREGLDLVARMRLLVEALREVADLSQEPKHEIESQPQENSNTGVLGHGTAVSLDALVQEMVEELAPVAESRDIMVDLARNPFPYSCWSLQDTRGLLFRVLDSVMSLSAGGSILSVRFEPQERRGVVSIGWTLGNAQDRRTYTGPDLGLIVARTAWERGGGNWIEKTSGGKRVIMLALPWAAGPTASSNVPAI